MPLVFVTGAGAKARNSIGLVLVGGMTIGTLFTLFIVPSLYVLIAHDVNKHKKGKPKAPEPQPAESAAAAEDEPEPEYVEQPVLARRRADEGGPAAWQPV